MKHKKGIYPVKYKKILYTKKLKTFILSYLLIPVEHKDNYYMHYFYQYVYHNDGSYLFFRGPCHNNLLKPRFTNLEEALEYAEQHYKEYEKRNISITL